MRKENKVRTKDLKFRFSLFTFSTSLQTLNWNLAYFMAIQVFMFLYLSCLVGICFISFVYILSATSRLFCRRSRSICCILKYGWHWRLFSFHLVQNKPRSYQRKSNWITIPQLNLSEKFDTSAWKTNSNIRIIREKETQKYVSKCIFPLVLRD